MTFLSPISRSLNHLKGSLNHPRKVTKNYQVASFFASKSFGIPSPRIASFFAVFGRQRSVLTAAPGGRFWLFLNFELPWKFLKSLLHQYLSDTICSMYENGRAHHSAQKTRIVYFFSCGWRRSPANQQLMPKTQARFIGFM